MKNFNEVKRLSDITHTPLGFVEQLPKNLIANIANFILNIIIGILLIPYFIGTLGVAVYGLIPLATSLTSYVTILTESLNVAVARFLTVDLHKDDYRSVNKTFNTALFGLSGIVLISIPAVIGLSYFAPMIFNVPTGQESEVVLLFLEVMSALLIRSWSSNFTVTLYAHNRLDLQNLLNAISTILQVSLIVLLFTIFTPRLSYIGISYLVSSIIFLLGAIILSKRINPSLHINIHDFDRSRLKDLTLMGWWAVVNQIGTILFLQIDLIAVNLLCGAIATGEYAIVLVWAILLRGIAYTLVGVLNPMILAYYAKDKLNEIILISKSAVKGLGLFLALPIGLICGFASQLLTLWVGPQFANLAPLMWILTLPLVINLCVLPLFTINIAYNKVRIPGIMTLVMGIGNVILAFSLPLLLGWGFYGVAIAGAIILTLKNTFFIPWYATKIMCISADTFTKSIISGTVAALLIAGVAFIIGNIFTLASLTNLVIFGGIISGLYLLCVWFFCLNQFERQIFLQFVPRQMRSE